MPDDATAKRKDAHLDLCATGDVAPRENDTLLSCVKLVHSAMPELALDEVQLTTTWFGKALKAPILVTGMTGGSERAGQVNRDLAQAAEEIGVAFGVGSQRAMAERSDLIKTFAVRDVAPNTVLLGNIGLRQAVALGLDGVRKLTDLIGADALALHLNPGQELTQPEGDRDFRGGYRMVEQLAKAYPDRFLVKETGCGLAPDVVKRLTECGVRHLDVSGLGGTSWVRVEQLRSDGLAREVGAELSGWGVPTAAAIALGRRAAGAHVTLVASGGLRTGLDMARAMALGADLGGAALPLFRAQQQGGVNGVKRALELLVTSLRQVLALCSVRTVAELRRRPFVVTGELKDWLTAL
ncbi:MAG: type 2 isopentenyl-diphosphate Delta-isomerase [Myxococcaceae bacterium]|nr:type 2 isopentenyl-diphosphate Delta-isomerase [Myxococcaceae bacterium]